jgi:hypothetical protein
MTLFSRLARILKPQEAMTPDTLPTVCRSVGRALDGCVTHEGVPVDGARLLWALAGTESAFGVQREYVRDEKGYRPGGPYYFRGPHVRDLWKRYGVLASGSYGSFQMLFVTAYELGFRDHPITLQDDPTCAAWASVLIRDRFVQRQGVKTLTDLLDCYNTGSHRKGIPPKEYLAKALPVYAAGLPS